MFILYIFIVTTLIQLAYWGVVFQRLAWSKLPKSTIKPAHKQAVSVVICARNEAANLRKHLPHILRQQYTPFEVVVVNDASTDESAELLAEWSAQYAHLRVISLEESTQSLRGKKRALTAGIQAARYPVVLLTDADCQPVSDQWVATMQSYLGNGIEIGLGYGPYYFRRGFLNRFIRFETIYTAIQYGSLALWGLPYMGVGRNLIYQKHVFEKTGGLKRHGHLLSGDDDLFVNQAARSDNVALILDKTAFVYSEPKQTWKEFYRQKKRHLSTGKYYQLKHQLILGALSASHFLHYCSICLLITFDIEFNSVLILYLIRMAVIMIAFRGILIKLDSPKLLRWVPFLDFTFILYYIIFTPALLLNNLKQWK